MWKSLAAQHHFVALTGHTKSNQTEFVQLVAAKKLCSEGSGFHLNSSVNTKRFVRAADSLPVYKEQFVAPTCRCNMSLRESRPSHFLTSFAGDFTMTNLK